VLEAEGRPGHRHGGFHHPTRAGIPHQVIGGWATVGGYPPSYLDEGLSEPLEEGGEGGSPVISRALRLRVK
jgi:hypothetical protein